MDALISATLGHLLGFVILLFMWFGIPFLMIFLWFCLSAFIDTIREIATNIRNRHHNRHNAL